MKVMIDIDGVLADFVLGITKKINEKHPEITPFSTPEQSSWDFRELPKGFFLEAFKEATDKKNAFYFNYSLEPLITPPQAQRLQDLSMEHEVYYATNRPGGIEALKGTRAFLEDKLKLFKPNVVLTAKKGEFAAAIEATHAIDDKAGNVVYTKYHSPSTEVFLLDRLYNRFDQTVLGTKVKRISSFSEFLDTLKPQHEQEFCTGPINGVK